MLDHLAACQTLAQRGQSLAQKCERGLRTIQTAKPAAKGGGVGDPIRIDDSWGRGFQRAVFHKVAPQGLTAGEQAVVCVRERKNRQESKGLATTVADAAPDLNPVMMPIVRLLAATAVADDRIAIAQRASARNGSGAIGRPVSLQIDLIGGKWDKENRTNGGSARTGVDLPRSEPDERSPRLQ